MTVLRQLIWLPLLLGASPAYAHAPVPGIKGFYIGFLHPFSTPSQALLMLGLGLLIGSFAVEKVRWQLSTFLIISILGLFFGSASQDPDIAMYCVAVVACSFAALIPGKISPVAIMLTVIGAFLIGSVSIPDDGPTRDRVFTMSGSILGANLGLLYIFGMMHFVREHYPYPWIKIAFRVAAAWLGAVALLMLALAFAPQTSPV